MYDFSQSHLVSSQPKYTHEFHVCLCIGTGVEDGSARRRSRAQVLRHPAPHGRGVRSPLPSPYYTAVSIPPTRYPTTTVQHLPGADGLDSGYRRRKQGTVMQVNSTQCLLFECALSRLALIGCTPAAPGSWCSATETRPARSAEVISTPRWRWNSILRIYRYRLYT